MKRVLEPEIMDDDEKALAYAKADFSLSNQFFVDRLVAEYSSHMNHVLDLGCGPADIPVRLIRKIPSIRITAIDASAAMVRLARQAVIDSNLQDQISVVEGRLCGLSLKNGNFDTIISKDLLHHLPDPTIFWQELRRLAKKNTVVCVMDLFRPRSIQDAKAIVESVSGDEPDILKTDFYKSLLAAFTVDEVAKQFHNMGMELSIRKVSERHFLVTGLIDGS
jgi:ubiquinone/menaquinone biosynthesis C-methylase UbiE